ncbi:hypothetical protein PR048_006797 [Dryococelus australis]|uniref:Uncharacterized protein n=1 Tax=Dryococelus australis TaxID=614101 RepID=A0ABQ9ICK5_9NEOP|nr:hypothetical protein PR048_006797 [Dryococelus australis]
MMMSRDCVARVETCCLPKRGQCAIRCCWVRPDPRTALSDTAETKGDGWFGKGEQAEPVDIIYYCLLFSPYILLLFHASSRFLSPVGDVFASPARDRRDNCRLAGSAGLRGTRARSAITSGTQSRRVHVQNSERITNYKKTPIFPNTCIHFPREKCMTGGRKQNDAYPAEGMRSSRVVPCCYLRVRVSASRSPRSPPTRANRLRTPAGPLPDFRLWESCRTIPLVDGFSRGSPVSHAFAFRRCSVFTSFTPYRLPRLRRYHELTSKRRLDIFVGKLRHFAGVRGWSSRNKRLFHLRIIKLESQYPDEPDTTSPTQRSRGEYGAAPECKSGNNPQTSGVVRHDSRVRKSGRNPAPGFALAGGEGSSRCTTLTLSTRVSEVSERIWAALNSEVLRADVGEYGAAPEWWAGEAGDLREDLPTNGIVRHDSHLRESGDPAGD